MRTQHVPPGGQTVRGRQRIWAYGLLKNAVGSFTEAIHYSKSQLSSYNLLEKELRAKLATLSWMLLILLADMAGDDSCRSHTSREVKVTSGMRAREKSRGKNKLAFSNTNATTEKTVTKAGKKCWQEEVKNSQKAVCRWGFETEPSIRGDSGIRQRRRRKKKVKSS